jgi:two-component system chemotaxis family response regulator WspR
MVMHASNNPATVTALPSDDYAIMVLLVDDQALVGEAIRRTLANQPDMDFHYCADATGPSC